ncbi:MAG: flagellar biosynthesis anti-sigma factor FlgM [Synergistaceae bacterium]|jgi:negative regulator of flagellin synthesis FlgM|nr:flagellar biosynthesis anti-sigma factor FlgM [Synergistaceae bacterium]
MIDKINDVTGVSGIGSLKQKKGTGFDAEDLVNSKDDLAVSSFAREMANISAELNKIPDVREDRVRDLKRMVDDGTYEPDLGALAGRLIWAGINKPEL